MTKSRRESIYSHRHERHVARNGQSDLRYGMKKMGAGTANWGVLGDEVPNVEDIARAEIETSYQQQRQQQKGSKLNLVDQETFNTMRSPSASLSSTPTDEHESFSLEQAST